MTADDLSATLSGIGKRHHHGHTSNPRRDYCTADNQDWPCDVASLLAAIDAVLKLHVPVERGRVMRCCEGCEDVNGDWHEDCCHEWPCPTYEEITRELSGTRQTQPGEDGES